ncbi:MAG: FkbM family methyltransferase [Chthoniobacterales bacterium]
MEAESRADLLDLLRSGGPPLEPLPTREILIYGAGNCGRSLGEAAIKAGFSVLGFLDASAASIPEVDGIRCSLPESPAGRWAAAAGVPVVLGIFNFATDLRPVRELLRGIGFSRIISLYEFNEHLDRAPQFWLTKRRFYRDNKGEILAGFDLLKDAVSRRIFCQHIALRLTFDLDLLASPDQESQYVPADLPFPAGPLRLIDGGAYTGDTLDSFLRKGIEFEAVVAFEPDLENFHRLGDLVAKRPVDFGEISLWPCGLADHTGIQKFATGHGAGSSLRAAITDWLISEPNHTQVVALDDVMPTFAPSLIKLDIEGAEPAALLGAQRLITRVQPTLAVCVYHEPDHLWTIPLLIHRLWPEYRIALRYHQFNGFDVVAYAFRE